MRRLLERYVYPIFLPFAGAVTGVGAGIALYPEKVYWSIGTVFFVTASAVFSSRNNKRADVATETAVAAKASLATALTGAGQPLVTVLAELSSAQGDQEYREQIAVLQDRTVGIARVQCGRTVRRDNSDHVRAAFYEFDPTDPNKLLRRKYEGRGGLTPRKSFEEGHSRGDDGVIGVARAENSVLVNDINKDAPAYLDRNGRSFLSYLSVPVQASGRSYGLLVVDSDKANSFNEVDVGYVTLLAKLLASGLAQSSHGQVGEATG